MFLQIFVCPRVYRMETPVLITSSVRANYNTIFLQLFFYFISHFFTAKFNSHILKLKLCVCVCVCVATRTSEAA
jgi:hypothetical protein